MSDSNRQPSVDNSPLGWAQVVESAVRSDSTSIARDPVLRVPRSDDPGG